MRSFPQHLAGSFVEGLHRPLAARVQQDVFENDQPRSEVERHCAAADGRFGTPGGFAGSPVDRDDFCAVVNVNPLRPGRQRQRSDGRRAAPVDLAGLGVNRHHDARLLVPAPVFADVALVAHDRVDRSVIFKLRLALVDEGEDCSLVDDEFFRPAGFLERPQNFARLRIDRRDRSFDPESHVDDVLCRDESSGELSRTALQRPEVVMPGGDRFFPEDRSVKRVAANEHPFRRHLNRNARAFVHDVKQPAGRRDEGAHAGHAVVVARPARAAQPLQMLRRPDDRVVSDRVPAGVVQKMSPVVDLFRARLDDLLPAVAGLRQCDSLRRENSQDFLVADAARVGHDDEVRKVVDVRQLFSGQLFHGHRAVKFFRRDRLASFRDVLRAPGQPVYLKPVVRLQSRGQ